jgi:uncharacterized protein (UPF0332 family)
VTPERLAEITALFSRAEDSFSALKALSKTAHHDIIASRCYYAVFYASSAWLLYEGHEYGKHSGVIAAVH